jgi:hypothetical protein
VLAQKPDGELLNAKPGRKDQYCSSYGLKLSDKTKEQRKDSVELHFQANTPIGQQCSAKAGTNPNKKLKCKILQNAKCKLTEPPRH